MSTFTYCSNCGHTWAAHTNGGECNSTKSNREGCGCQQWTARFVKPEPTMAAHSHGGLSHANHYWTEGDMHDHRPKR